MVKAFKENCNSIKEEELFNNLQNRLHIARSNAYNNLNNYFLSRWKLLCKIHGNENTTI